MPISPSRRAAAVQLPIIPVVADWIRSHPGTLSLGQGVAGYEPPPEAWRELERLHREPLLHRYQPVGGLPELVEGLQTKLARVNGIRVGSGADVASETGLMVTAGSNAAFLQIILAICDPGDEVILPVPYFFNQEMALTMTGVRPVLVPGGADHQPDPDRIAAAITSRTRAVVTVSPNNPSGAVLDEAALREINRRCAERGIHHISDEAYEAFVHDGARHVSPGAFADAAGHTISLFSFSKAYGFASWRIGYAVVPATLLEPLRKIQDTNLICPPVVSQLAALGCLRAGDAWVADRVREVSAVRERVLEGLRDIDDLAEFGAPRGAFYVLLRLRTRADPLELTRRLIAEHRVAVIPGSAFGFGPDDPCHLRVAYGALERATATEAIGRLTQGLRAILGSPGVAGAGSCNAPGAVR